MLDNKPGMKQHTYSQWIQKKTKNFYWAIDKGEANTRLNLVYGVFSYSGLFSVTDASYLEILAERTNN